MSILKRGFRSTETQDCFLCGSSLFAFANTGFEWYVPESEDERQLLAQLHCLYGSPRNSWEAEDARFDTIGYARARVYNLSLYTGYTRWGPFMDNDSGDVDWEKLEAIMIVLGYNSKFGAYSNSKCPRNANISSLHQCCYTATEATASGPNSGRRREHGKAPPHTVSQELLAYNVPSPRTIKLLGFKTRWSDKIHMVSRGYGIVSSAFSTTMISFISTSGARNLEGGQPLVSIMMRLYASSR